MMHTHRLEDARHVVEDGGGGFGAAGKSKAHRSAFCGVAHGVGQRGEASAAQVDLGGDVEAGKAHLDGVQRDASPEARCVASHCL